MLAPTERKQLKESFSIRLSLINDERRQERFQGFKTQK